MAKKKKFVNYHVNGRVVRLDQDTLRWLARDLESAHRFLMKHAKTPAHAYICAKSWADSLRHLASEAK